MPFSFCITTKDAVLLDCVNIFIHNINIASYYKHLFQVLDTSTKSWAVQTGLKKEKYNKDKPNNTRQQTCYNWATIYRDIHSIVIRFWDPPIHNINIASYYKHLFQVFSPLAYIYSASDQQCGCIRPVQCHGQYRQAWRKKSTTKRTNLITQDNRTIIHWATMYRDIQCCHLVPRSSHVQGQE